MTNERKNEIWAMLPEDFRREATAIYKTWVSGSAASAMIKLFGKHNLTAQPYTEPKKPRFNIGDKVRISCQYANGETWDSVMHNRIVTIKDYYYKDDENMYVFEENYRDFGEIWLEPYTPASKDAELDASQDAKISKGIGQNPLDVAESVETSTKEDAHFADNKHFVEMHDMINYAQYRLDLAKEIAVAMIGNNDGYGSIACEAVAVANEIVKRLKETEI